MKPRPLIYWSAFSLAAILLVGATDYGMAAMLDIDLPDSAAASILPVPEPSRAFLLFAGIMAMAFTYRSAWLSWKRKPVA